MSEKVYISDLISAYSLRNTENRSLPVYSVTNSHGFTLSTEYFNKKVFSKDTSNYKIVPFGAFAYNPSRINVGSISWQDKEKEVIVSPLYNVFTLKHNVDARYLNYFFHSPYCMTYINAYATGSVRNTLDLKSLGKIPIILPEEKEQKRVVKILDCLIKIITHRKQALELMNELVKSRFIEMFGDINVNNRGWTIQPLGELCTIVRGGSPRPIEKFLGGDVPWIKIGDATDGESIYLYSTKEHIIREGVSKSRMVKGGSLIFANCGVSLGFARIITFDGCIHDGWLAMEDIDARLDKVFLLQSLNQMTEHFRKIAPAGTQPNLNTAIMKAYKQIIPPMKLQKDFIAFVEQTDKSRLLFKCQLLQYHSIEHIIRGRNYG